MMAENPLFRKQLEFNNAMKRYEGYPGYKLFGLYVSLVNTFSPFMLLFMYDFSSLSFPTIFASAFVAELFSKVVYEMK